MSEQLLFKWSTFCDSSMGTKLKYFWKSHEILKSARNFFTKTCLTNNYFSCGPHYVILVWYKVEIFLKISWKCVVRLNFFRKNMSHKQLLFTWSPFRDSSMGTKFKYFWKTHETVKSARIFSQKHVSQTMTFHVIHISWFQHRYKVEIFLKNSWNCEVNLAGDCVWQYIWHHLFWCHDNGDQNIFILWLLHFLSLYLFWIHWFVCKLIYLCFDQTHNVWPNQTQQCSHPNGKHLLDW